MITLEEMKKLAKLSRLELSDAELELHRAQFGPILGHIDQLRALDLSNVEPLTGVESLAGVLREDVVHPGLDREQAFRNAPSSEAGHFTIPKVIG